MRQRLGGFGPACQMIQNTLHDCRVFDAGDDLDGTTAVAAGFDIDLEHVINPKQTLKYLHLEGLERVVLSLSLQPYSTDRFVEEAVSQIARKTMS